VNFSRTQLLDPSEGGKTQNTRHPCNQDATIDVAENFEHQLVRARVALGGFAVLVIIVGGIVIVVLVVGGVANAILVIFGVVGASGRCAIVIVAAALVNGMDFLAVVLVVFVVVIVADVEVAGNFAFGNGVVIDVAIGVSIGVACVALLGVVGGKHQERRRGRRERKPREQQQHQQTQQQRQQHY